MERTAIPPELLPQIAAGDEGAFERLYRATYRQVYSFLLSLTMNQDDAKDLLQETYIRVHGSAHLYREQGNPMAWIMKIGRNLFLMEKRKKTAIPIDTDTIQMQKELSFDNITNVESKLYLEELFTILTEEERTIVVLHSAAGFRHREIAEFLDMPLGTVLSKYNRAMKKLEAAAKKSMSGGSDVR